MDFVGFCHKKYVVKISGKKEKSEPIIPITSSHVCKSLLLEIAI